MFKKLVSRWLLARTMSFHSLNLRSSQRKIRGGQTRNNQHARWLVFLFFSFCFSLFALKALNFTKQPRDKLWKAWTNVKMSGRVRRAQKSVKVLKRLCPSVVALKKPRIYQGFFAPPRHTVLFCGLLKGFKEVWLAVLKLSARGLRVFKGLKC